MNVGFRGTKNNFHLMKNEMDLGQSWDFSLRPWMEKYVVLAGVVKSTDYLADFFSCEAIISAFLCIGLN